MWLAAAAAGDVRDGGGDGLLVLNAVETDSSSGTMRVGSLTGHGLNCSNLTLISMPSAAGTIGQVVKFMV
jgi:hypothetical protein